MNETPDFITPVEPSATIPEVPEIPPVELTEDSFYLAIKQQERYIVQTNLNLLQMSQSIQMMRYGAQEAKDQGLRVRYFQDKGQIFFTAEPKTTMGFNPKK